MQTAKAAVFTGVEQPFEIRSYPVLPPDPGMAKVRLIASGVCGTDIHFHRGKIPLDPPKIIGHEFIGRIEELNTEGVADCTVQVGDTVIIDIACPCEECLLCHEGDDANCVHMGVTNGGHPDEAPHFWGGFGEYNYAPIKNLIPIPSQLDPKIVSVYACAGPTAIHAFNLAKKANCHLETATVAVVQGLGPVGTFAVAYMASLGIKHIIALTADRNQSRNELAMELGATEVINLLDTSEEELVARILELTDGRGADLVFEASGSVKAVPTGLTLLRNRGVYLIPGQYSNSGGATIQPQLITFKALQLIGSSQYSVCDVHEYLRLLEKTPSLCKTMASLITAYPLEEINQAFEDAKAGKNIKTILV